MTARPPVRLSSVFTVSAAVLVLALVVSGLDPWSPFFLLAEAYVGLYVGTALSEWTVRRYRLDAVGHRIAHAYTRWVDHSRWHPCRTCGSKPGEPCVPTVLE